MGRQAALGPLRQPRRASRAPVARPPAAPAPRAPPPPCSPPLPPAPPQDLLTYSVKGLSCWAHWAKAQGVAVPQEVYNFIQGATFSTLTNVNFDDARFKVRPWW